MHVEAFVPGHPALNASMSVCAVVVADAGATRMARSPHHKTTLANSLIRFITHYTNYNMDEEYAGNIVAPPLCSL